MNWPQMTPQAEEFLAQRLEAEIQPRTGKPPDCVHHPDNLHVQAVFYNDAGAISWGSLRCDLCDGVFQFFTTSA